MVQGMRFVVAERATCATQKREKEGRTDQLERRRVEEKGEEHELSSTYLSSDLLTTDD